MKKFGFGLGLGSMSAKKQSGPTYLDSVLDSTVFDLDATQSDSYSGSGQTWANLTSSPADGESQTAYDFFLGADGTSSTDDPTYTGSGQSAYFSHDGGDFFQLAGGNTTLINGVHKTTGGTAATFIYTFSSAAGNSSLFGTGDGNGADGFQVLELDGTRLSLFQYDGSGNERVDDTELGTGDILLAVALDTTNGIIKIAQNASTFTDLSGSFVPLATTNNATAPFKIGSSDDSSLPVPNGWKTYSFAAFNKILTDEELASTISHLEERHGRTYV